MYKAQAQGADAVRAFNRVIWLLHGPGNIGSDECSTANGCRSGSGEMQLAVSGDERPNGKELSVLIVDNSPSLRDVMQPVLEEEEEIIIQGEAENGMQAIEMTDQLKPDVILLADDIPDLTSEEAAERIKQRYPNTRVIIVTAEEAWRDEILRKEAARKGSSGYVTRRENVGRVLSAIKDELLTRKPEEGPGLPTRARSIWSFGKFWQAVGMVTVLSLLAAFIAYPEVLLPLAALTCGGIFFSYGVKYYLSVAFVLLATRNGNGNGNGNGYSNGNGNGRGLNGLGNGNGTNGHLSRQPFVSIHLPLYNEMNVVDRLMSAATSLDYKNYEVIVADDSTDETTDILNKRWGAHPRVKISHRENREGFKGAALQVALERTDPRAEFIVVLDADFVPPPDILKQFLSHFFDLNGNGHGAHKKEMRLLDESVAVVQGYQWHVLNANENWITSGIRSEFSGSYVVERSSQEITGGMKMVAGSVFMIRTDVLRKIGWNTSITEDWQLTIRLYLEGYKVLYSPFIQAPAECVSTFKQLTRQRMRWAEGHTFNVKKYFWPMVLSPRVTIREKLEFFYFAPYYLQSAFFLFGTMAWLISDVVLKFRLPYWSEVLGWSLVIVNSISLPMMNLSGLFLERGASKSWRGILSFWLLSYLLAPYQAYAALKGLFEPKEGGWHRTHKTGVVTEAIDKLALKKHLKGLTRKMKKRQVNLGGRLGGAPAKIISQVPSLLLRLPRRPSLGFRLSTGMAICLVLVWIVSSQLPIASAAANVLFLRDTTTNGATPAGEDMNESLGSSEDTTVFDDASDEAYWYTEDTFPEGGDDASIAAGSYTMQMYFDSLLGAGTLLVDDSNYDTTIGGSSITIAHTTSGTYRLMIVGVSINPENNEFVTGITWNTSETLTKVRHDVDDNEARTEIWYLTNPTATSADVVVSFNTSLAQSAIAGVVTFTGVDQTTPLGDDNGDHWLDEQYPSISVTTDEGDMVFGVVSMEWKDITATDADTEHWRVNDLGDECTGGGGTKAGAASSTSIGWSFDDHDQTAISAVAIKPAGGVDIVVSAYHTNSSGGDATEITTSSTVTITKDTANPLSVDLGAGAAQAFTSADPRRLRVHIDVTGVSSGASFTMAYDSASKGSYLATPDFVVPGVSLLLVLLVIFIPIFMNLVVRKQRLVTQVGMIVACLVAVLAILGGSVTPVDAAANVLYFRDTTTNGATPAGEDMNESLGSSENTVLFDDASDEAYWYTEDTFPEGGEDASIAAGNYTLQMFFDQLPSAWWDTSYLYRKQITVNNGTEAVDANYTVSLTFDHDTLAPAKSLISGNDIRIGYWNGSGWVEVSRALDPLSSWDDAATKIWFPLQSGISASGSDNNYYLYYGNSSAGSPPDDWADVYLMGDDFEDGTLTTGVDTSINGGQTISETGGEAFIDNSGAAIADAGIIVTDSSIASDREFAIRHMTRLVSGGGPTNPEAKAIGVVESASQPTYADSSVENPRRRIIIYQRVDTDSKIFYINTSSDQVMWDGASWTTTESFWGTLSLDTNYIHELISDGTDWYIRVSEADGTVLTTTTSVPWSSVKDSSDPFWFYWGDPYTDFYFMDQKSEWVYLRDYVDPEPTTNLSVTEVDAPFVNVTVSVYHTNPTGGDATEIITSSSTKIDANVGDPYDIDIGSGVAQNFTQADPRRLRVRIEVDSVNGAGSFTLAYDSVASSSNMATPDFVVPGASLLFALLVIFIPIFMNLVMRKQGLGSHVGMIAISVIGVIAIVAGSVTPVGAAPDVFYLHDTDTGPGSLDVWVTASSDDAEEASGGGMDLTSSDLELAVEAAAQTVGMRFLNITVPQGAMITNAYIQFTGDESCGERNVDPVSLDIVGQLSTSAGTFTSDPNDITIGRPQTAASVNWVPPSWDTDGERAAAQRTPDLKTIIQEIVDQGAWASGNPLVIIIDGSGRRQAESWDGADAHGDLTLAPQIHIEWTPANPSGKWMDDTAGSVEATLVFDGTDDEAYWYTDLTYPTGGGDASIAAGSYTLNMYFDALPGPTTITIADVDYDFTEGGDSITVPHNPSGSNLLMIVGISINREGGEDVTGVTWNGTEDLTNLRIDTEVDDAQTEIWYLVNPTATSANVVVTMTDPLNSAAIAGVVTFTGVDTGDPFRAHNGDNWAMTSNPSVTVSSELGDMIFGVVDIEDQDVTGTDADTEHWRENQLGNPSNSCTGSGVTTAGAATSTTVSWTAGAADHATASVVSIKPAAAVDIVVSAYHTDSSGGDATEITTSSTVTIDQSTTNPVAVDIDSGLAQTFQASDPRRLRVHIDVTGITSGGSFTLAYDSAGNPSDFSTPAIVVPEASMLFLLVVIFIPVGMKVLPRRRRQVVRIAKDEARSPRE